MTSAICIDGFNLVRPQGTGIATYSRNLLTTARSIGYRTSALFGPSLSTTALRGFETVAVLNPPPQGSSMRIKDRVARTMHTRLSPVGRKAHLSPLSPDVIWPGGKAGEPAIDACWTATDLFQRAHRAFKHYKQGTPVTFDTAAAHVPAVMHWTTLLPLHARNVPNIYTIHDLIPLRLPHTTLTNKALFLDICREVAKRADHIAVVSEATRYDVIRMLGVPEERVTNTYQAVDLPPILVNRPQVEVEMELEAAFGLEWDSYFLHFGAIEPKKNLGRLVEAYLASGVRRPLVVVGGPGWLSDPETILLRQEQMIHGANSRIRLLDYASYTLLISLIRGARGVLFPSLYEGFGLPLLEAMSLGTSVLISDQGSLPEVAGEAALQVDPYDTSAIARGVQQIDADGDWRAWASEQGRIQAAKFSAEAYQVRLRELYAKVGVTP
ncbi:glycosyltransferase family 4 protein [Brevundimonas phoenicis]|uniref:glycosyltransferase family 4 protein n=1 Tax=unclassified Brevundimonas TaxID=2622653 RepID=UPI0039A19A00